MVAVWLPTLRRAQSVVVASKVGIKERERRVEVFFYGLFVDEELLRGKGLEPEGVAGVTGFSSVAGRKRRPAVSGLFVGIQQCQRESSPGVG